MSKQVFVVIKVGKDHVFESKGIYLDRQKAEKIAALCSGLVIEATKVARVPIVKKANTFPPSGEKSVSTLAIDDVEITDEGKE